MNFWIFFFFAYVLSFSYYTQVCEEKKGSTSQLLISEAGIAKPQQ